MWAHSRSSVHGENSPPSPWALRQQQGGVLSTSGVPCDPDPMPPVGHSLAPTAAEAISGLNHPPERECYTFRCRNIYELRLWGGGCPRPHRGVRSHTTHAPMLHSYNPNHPGSGHVAGLEPGALCPLRVTEPRAARVPRRGQKPPGGRFWEDFRGTGAGRRGSRGLPRAPAASRAGTPGGGGPACAHLQVGEVPGAVVLLATRPGERGPEVHLHQLPVGAEADVAEDAGGRGGGRTGKPPYLGRSPQSPRCRPPSLWPGPHLHCGGVTQLFPAGPPWAHGLAPPHTGLSASGPHCATCLSPLQVPKLMIITANSSRGKGRGPGPALESRFHPSTGRQCP